MRSGWGGVGGNGKYCKCSSRPTHVTRVEVYQHPIKVLSPDHIVTPMQSSLFLFCSSLYRLGLYYGLNSLQVIGPMLFVSDRLAV